MREFYPATKANARAEKQKAMSSALMLVASLTGNPVAVRDPDVVAPAIREAIEKYAREHHPVGDFLTAVMANDFMDAALRADPYNACTLGAIALLVEDVVPARARGSRQAVQAWVKAWRGEERAVREATPEAAPGTL